MHEVQNIEKIVQYRSTNPKEYWRLLKETADSRFDNNITSEEFEVYFKGLSDPDDPFYVADDDIKQCNEQYERDELQILFEELNVPNEMEELRKALKQLQNGASAGPDLLLLFF